MYILVVLGPLLFFLMLNSLTVLVSNRKFGVCMGFTMLAAGLALFISQVFFNSFHIGFILLIGCCIIPILLFIGLNDKKGFIRNYFSTGFYAFVAIYFIVLIINIGNHIDRWDEYAHWAPMTMEMLRLDRFYSVPWARVFEHKEYPPFAAIFEYLWIRLSGKHLEMEIYFALEVLQYSLMIPFIIDKNAVRKNGGGKERTFTRDTALFNCDNDVFVLGQ